MVIENMNQKPAYIFFDLDSTLYSARYGLEKAVGRRVNEFIADFLKLSLEEAYALRRERLAALRLGTTMEWLVAERGMTADQVEEYYRYIHPENEAADLPPDRELARLLETLNVPKSILTNATREHAQRLLQKMEITEHFEKIFDIRFNGFRGKPGAQAYQRALDAAAVKPGLCLLVDDVPGYVEGYRAIGGLGVLYDELNIHPGFPGPRIRHLDELTDILRDGLPG
jgi:putative hydrolase of the HAD superfamily